ncbi:Putative DNA helicase MCM9 [Picochlorum sp. SENEW3]|nr:Putative DNA helicase MCM9 [Picochlorum sp. SENEW3]
MSQSDSLKWLEREISDYLYKRKRQDIVRLLLNAQPEDHQGLPLSLTELGVWNLEVAEYVFNNPIQSIEAIETGILRVQNVVLQELVAKQEGGDEEGIAWEQQDVGKVSTPVVSLSQRHRYSVKENVHARLFGPAGMMNGLAPLSPGQSVARSELVDCLVTLTGTVARTGVVKVLESRKLFECASCGYKFAVVVDDFTNDVSLPQQCPSSSSTGGVGSSVCTGGTFRQCPSDNTFTNYQEIYVQEVHSSDEVYTSHGYQGGDRTSSNSRKAVTVILQDDLADCCQIGDEVHITGIVIRHGSTTPVGAKAVVTLAVKAVSLVVQDDQDTHSALNKDTMYAKFEEFWTSARVQGSIFTARDVIVNSLCPMLSGMFGVKLSVLLMLLGGVSQHDITDQESQFDGTDAGSVKRKASRADIHVLLVGDPGTGKSQIQKFVTHVCPKAVITSGSSASSAGLTAAAVKENGQWTLEAGALVLANGGVCCIDEIDGLKQSESSALHEVMEQQTCSLAKAGMVSTLQTKVSVFGTCNPKGNRRIDPRKTLDEQLALSSPLLSRFDIILLLLDDMNPAADAVIVDHILNMRGHAGDVVLDTKSREGKEPHDSLGDMWDIEMLRNYIQWCKMKFHPLLSQDAKRVLISYYQARRSFGSDHVTVRFFESLIRLSQAHAKLMARHEVGIHDAVVAICLADASIGITDGGVLQIPSNLRMGEMGYYMNTESAEVKVDTLKSIVLETLDVQSD